MNSPRCIEMNGSSTQNGASKDSTFLGFSSTIKYINHPGKAKQPPPAFEPTTPEQHPALKVKKTAGGGCNEEGAATPNGSKPFASFKKH